ncbi:hypothetical protein [Siculibacillus lacustris]|nr:hypothetical protein [Siculibacillus lacustris]
MAVTVEIETDTRTLPSHRLSPPQRQVTTRSASADDGRAPPDVRDIP